MADKNPYNWLDDPFDEKKNAQLEQEYGLSSRSKILVGVGCLVVVVAIIALIASAIGMLGALALN